LSRQGFENLWCPGRIEWRRARGCERLKYLDSLCDRGKKDNMSPTQLIGASEDRVL